MVLYLTAFPGGRKEYNAWAFMLFKEKTTSVGNSLYSSINRVKHFLFKCVLIFSVYGL